MTKTSTVTTYAIGDAQGNQLTTGYSDLAMARKSAQKLANERGDVVQLYSLDLGTDEGTELCEDYSPVNN